MAERYLERIVKKIKEKTESLEVLERIVDKEYRDIAALESTPMQQLFSKLLSNRSEQLEIEKQEYLDAVLNYKDAVKTIELLRFEATVLQEKVMGRAEKELLIEELLKIRERQIEKKDKSYVSEFLRLCNEYNQAVKLKAEIVEAKIEGLRSKKQSNMIIAYLKKAAEFREWGFKKGKPTTTFERKNVDQAVDTFYKLKVSLLKFESELDDVFARIDSTKFNDLRKFDHFIEVYYNYLINDWVVKEKISNTIFMMEGLQNEILRLLNSLDHKEELVLGLITKIERRKNDFITGEG